MEFWKICSLVAVVLLLVKASGAQTAAPAVDAAYSGDGDVTAEGEAPFLYEGQTSGQTETQTTDAPAQTTPDTEPVYQSTESFPVTELEDLGCWKDNSNRAIPPLEGQDDRLDGPYIARVDAISKCREAALSRGYTVFAVQNGGWCASSADAEDTYQKYGPTDRCRADGEGGPWANQVYRIITEIPTGGCKDPGMPANGKKLTEADSYPEDSVVHFECNEGYAMEGNNSIVCQSGTWSSPAPYCSGVFVSCGDKIISVTILRDFILNLDGSHLNLRRPTCRPTENDTHVTFTFDIGSCGTTIGATDDEIIYQNVVRTREVSASAVIRRYPDIEIPIYCSYPRKLKVSLGDKYVIPNKYHSILDEEHATGQFVGQFRFYHDQEFQEAYPDDVTVEANYKDDVYFGINIGNEKNEMTRWKMRTDSCRGTSSADPDDEEATAYIFLSNGCSLDETLVRYVDDDPLSEKFAIEAFRFYDRDVGNLVYMHCDLVVCDVNTTQSLCDRGCGNHTITRRSLHSQPSVGTMRLSTGPLLIKNPDISSGMSKKVRNNIPAITIGVVTTVIAAIAITVGVVLYRRKHCGSVDVATF